MRGQKKVQSISQAVEAVDQASEQNWMNLTRQLKGELRSMNPEFENALNEIKEEAQKRLNSIRDKTKESTRNAVRSVDELVQNDPWPVIGFFSLLAGIFGFLLGRKSKR